MDLFNNYEKPYAKLTAFALEFPISRSYPADMNNPLAADGRMATGSEEMGEPGWGDFE